MLRAFGGCVSASTATLRHPSWPKITQSSTSLTQVASDLGRPSLNSTRKRRQIRSLHLIADVMRQVTLRQPSSRTWQQQEHLIRVIRGKCRRRSSPRRTSSDHPMQVPKALATRLALPRLGSVRSQASQNPPPLRSVSSPRGRGTLLSLPSLRSNPRFIPARAGNSWGFPHPRAFLSVHPRAGGELGISRSRSGRGSGSSPRGRGTRRNNRTRPP